MFFPGRGRNRNQRNQSYISFEILKLKIDLMLKKCGLIIKVILFLFLNSPSQQHNEENEGYTYSCLCNHFSNRIG